MHRISVLLISHNQLCPEGLLKHTALLEQHTTFRAGGPRRQGKDSHGAWSRDDHSHDGVYGIECYGILSDSLFMCLFSLVLLDGFERYHDTYTHSAWCSA